MAEKRVQRRLAAILAADVVGYSSLIGDDEVGTLAQLKDCRTEVIDPSLARYGGRVVKVMGDGVLVEFSSAVDAVTSAVEVQMAMAERNAAVPEDRRIVFRVGVNVGDVIVDGEDILGNGVNVAARLEGLSVPGGVCISGDVFRQVRGKVEADFEDLGPQAVKNIAEPVHAYSFVPIVAPTASGALVLPDKPSIAVLPFQNMSGDPEQEYFADGIAEDIITALSRFQWFFVIARNSSFTYKGRAVDIRQVGRELGVRYVLEGSVRKGGARLRITAQLIEAATGNHVWADRYDGEVTDVFELQDKITESIAGAVAPSFVSAEAKRLQRKAPESFDSWDYAIRGNSHLWRLNEENLAAARRNFEAAINLDPNNVIALGGLALACSWQVVWGWTGDADATRALADHMASRAVAADDLDAWAHYALGQVHLHRRRLEDAVRACRRALELNPNLAVAQTVLSAAYAWMGRYDAAIETVEKAVRLNPRDPSHAWFPLTGATAAFVVGRYEEQVQWAKKMIQVAPDHPAGWRFLAAGYGLLGREDEARAAGQGLLRVVPHFTIGLTRTAITGIRDEDLGRMLNGLRNAGLPE